jgi:LDH2 family malate/lactate/ureidoglycolate dehydrogenase
MTTGNEQLDHDPATCPGCLHADPPLGAARGIGIALMLEIGIGLLLGAVVVLYLAGY